MKKLILPLLLATMGWADISPVCDIFSDVLQTHDQDTKIKANGHSYIHDSPGCTLKTPQVDQHPNNNKVIECNEAPVTALGTPAQKLNIDYSFTLTVPNVTEKPGGGSNHEVKHQNEILPNNRYKKIYQDWHHYDFQLTYNGDKKINKFDNIIGSVIFKNNRNHTIKIGTFKTNSYTYSSTKLIFDDRPKAIKIYKLETGDDGTTFNAVIYTEGEANLGSPTYIKGALSAGDDIAIENNSHFYYDQGLTDEGWGSCAPYYDNRYSCGIFEDPIVTYDSLHVGENHPANNVQVCKSGSITYPADSYYGNGDINCNPNACGTGSCTRNDPPPNRLDYNIITSTKLGQNEGSSQNPLTELEYGDFNGNFDLTLQPAHTYENSNIKVMILGDVTLKGNGNTISLEPGDYYFNSLRFEKNGGKIILPHGGPVRIFIKNNLIFEKNSYEINKNGNASDLFFYIGGNLIASSTGMGNSTLKAFFYVKGEAHLYGNSNYEIYGGITSEGPFYIDGNNPHFYRGDSAENLGYGECKLCYTDIKVGGISFNFLNCGGFSMVQDIKVPIYASTQLQNVYIDEVHNKNIFEFSFMDTYDVLDENDNHLRDAITYNSGWNAGAMGMNMTLFGGKAIRYPLDKPYGPADAEHGYNQLHSSSLFNMSFNPCKWYESLVYVGHYDIGDRHYDIQVSKCKAPTPPPPPTYTTGPFDAWDTFRDINDRNISTKIVNREFSLTIASINQDNNQIEALDGKECQYQLYDMKDNTNITNWNEFNASTAPTTVKNFTIDKAYRNVRVKFRFCQKLNTYPIILAPLSKCQNSENGYEWNTTTYSRDNFAIRPSKFTIDTNLTNLKGVAGVDFNITFYAKDYNGNSTQNYNETINNSFKIDINETKTGCKKGIFNPDLINSSWQFANGEKSILSNYNEVGKINIKIHEINGSEFAIVDENDSNDEIRLIKPYELNITFTPHHFKIDTLLLPANANNYTYISEDLNMSATLKLDVTAKNEQNGTTENYNETCYAKETDYNITYSPDNIENLSKIIYEENRTQQNGEADINGTLLLKDFNFTIFSIENNGSAHLTLKINFDRDKTKAVRPFEFNITSITVVDEDNVTGSDKPNQTTYFYYARLHAPSEEINKIVGNKGDAKVYYEIYDPDGNNTGPLTNLKPSVDDIDWYINREHNLSDGKIINIASQPNNIETTWTPQANYYQQGIQKFHLKYSGDIYPYMAIFKLLPSPWLLYDKYDSNISNVTLDIKFVNTGVWKGVGKTLKKQNETHVSPYIERRINW